MIEVIGYKGNLMIARFLCVTDSVIEADKRFKDNVNGSERLERFFRPVDETDPSNLPLIKDYMLEKAII